MQVKDKEKEEYVRERKRKEKRGGWRVSDEEIEVRCAIGGVGEGEKSFFWEFF